MASAEFGGPPGSKGRVAPPTDGETAMAEKIIPKIRPGRVEQRIRSARDSLPGERNDLPTGSLEGAPVEPQGDENREPPPNAPTIPK